MKKKHRKTMRGTVLFTTVAVMALLILFLMGTLVLASASNSRAHKSYATSQASYTAKAAIDAFIQSMQSEGAIAAAVQEIAEPGGGGSNSIEIDIQMNDPSLGTIGYVNKDGDFVPNKIFAENVGGGEYEYVNEDTGESLVKPRAGATVSGAKWVELDRVKISAAARVGTIGGGEIETVTAYIRKMAGGKTEIQNNTAPSVKGIQMTGSAGFPAGKNITGGLGMNLSDSSDTPPAVGMRNQMSIETTLSFFNNDLVWNTSSTKIRVLNPKPVEGQDADIPYSQTVVNGNLRVSNDEWIDLEYTMPDGYNNDNPSWSNKEVPYVYVNGALSVDKLSVKDIGNHKSPFNIFCGTFTNEGGNGCNTPTTSIYMMDTYDSSKTYKVYTESDGNNGSVNTGTYKTVVQGDNYLGNNGSSTLESWAYSVVNGSTSGKDFGGSVYCNGRLTLEAITIDGDVRVAGDCIIKNNVTIKGRLIVGGTLTGTATVNGGTFTGQPKMEETTAEYTTVDNVLIPAGKADATNFDELRASDYKAYYIKWVPDNFKTVVQIPGENETDPQTEQVSAVDIFGNPVPVERINDPIYYKWVEGTVLNADTTNMINVIASTNNYEELAQNTQFQELLKKVDYQAHYETVTDPNDPSALNVSLKDGNDFYYYAVPTVYEGNPIASGTEASAEAVFYRNKLDNTVISQDEYNNLPEVPEHYVRCDINGEPTGDDAGSNAHTYYKNNAPDDWTYVESEAAVVTKTVAQDSPLPSDIKSIYPAEMTREAIYGKKDTQAEGGFQEADSSTKIVTTLKEARKSLGLNADGSLNADVYPTSFGPDDKLDLSKLPTAIENGEVKDSTVFKKSEGTSAPSSGFQTISESCVLKGKLLQHAGSVVEVNGGTAIPNSNVKINGSNDDFRVLYITPRSNDPLYIVLDNVALENPNVALVVDKTYGTGEVYFVVKGELKIDQAMIITTDYKKDMTFDYTKNWGISYYGYEGSKINITNPSTLIGCFKMPQTDFKAHVRGQMNVKYTGENGLTIDDNPVIVGNALFKSVDATNDFVNFYTATGGGNGGNNGGSKTILTKVGYFDVMYMSAS